MSAKHPVLELFDRKPESRDYHWRLEVEQTVNEFLKEDRYGMTDRPQKWRYPVEDNQETVIEIPDSAHYYKYKRNEVEFSSEPDNTHYPFKGAVPNGSEKARILYDFSNGVLRLSVDFE